MPVNTYKCVHCNAAIEQRLDEDGVAWVDPDDTLDGDDQTLCGGQGEQGHEPYIRVSRDSRDERGADGSMIEWTKPAEFDFANEVDGLTTLQELGDELRQIREHEKHVMRYLTAAAQAVRLQHQTQPQAIIRESGVARQTIYNMLAEIVERVGDNSGPSVSVDTAHRGAETPPPVSLQHVPAVSDELTCEHGTGPFTNIGPPGNERWVHADPACHRPTAAWLASRQNHRSG